MADLMVDIGNTLTKIAVMEGKRIVMQSAMPQFDGTELDKLSAQYDIQRAVVSSTGKGADEVCRLLGTHLKGVVRLDSQTALPIGIDYSTPHTLGVDRIALAVGACEEHGYDKCILVVDFGTAITVDRIDRGVFRGGNISLGAGSRFRALHEFTHSLPLCEPMGEVSTVFGTSTEEALQCGVMNGIVYEIEGYIERLRAENKDYLIIFTGGDAKFFVNRIKSAIFVSQNLMFYGLSKILDYNATDENE